MPNERHWAFPERHGIYSEDAIFYEWDTVYHSHQIVLQTHQHHWELLKITLSSVQRFLIVYWASKLSSPFWDSSLC